MITDGGNWYVASSIHGKMREMASKMFFDIFPLSIELFFYFCISFIWLFFRPLCEKKPLSAFSSFDLLCSCRACQETRINTSTGTTSYSFFIPTDEMIVRQEESYVCMQSCCMSANAAVLLFCTWSRHLYCPYIPINTGLSLNTRLCLHGDTPATPFP